ncbi:MAG: DUF6517 family protein [Haloglomus sp.]
MSRRAVAALLALLTITAGCSALTGNPTVFIAGQVSVSEAAQSETGYSLQEKRTLNSSRTFAGQEVKVVNHLGEYARAADLPVFGDTEIARFTVFATPVVEVAGQGPFNPVADLNNTELVLRLQEQYESISNVQRVGNRTETMLGTETSVGKFRADARTTAGKETEVSIHITKVRHEGDFVIAVAVYPTQLENGQQNVNRLLAGVQHSGRDGGGSETSA